MKMASKAETTRFLAQLEKGDRSAIDRLFPLVYNELRALAARSLDRETPGHTLQATALVHEAYLRLVDQKDAEWKSRAQFMAVAATVIRRILVERIRFA